MLEIVLLIIIAVGLGAGLFLIARFLKNQGRPSPDQPLLLLQNQINELTRMVDAKLGESTKVLREQFGQSARIIKEITQELTKVSEGHKQVMNITDQLKNLQDILKNPKQRGVLGEYYLETILKNVFSPKDYKMQYAFRDGTAVDAAIFVGNQIIPIDSKFSLENYNRLINENNPLERERLEKQFIADLKNRIDETSKYIKPSEKTVNIAFMFIPSEAIFYDLLVNQIGSLKSNTRDLIDYAYNEKHVIIVSPTTLAAYFQVLFQALKAFKIQESTEVIKKEIEKLASHLSRYEEYMAKLGKNLGLSVSSYDAAYKEFSKIDKDILKITGESIGAEPQILKQPLELEDIER